MNIRQLILLLLLPIFSCVKHGGTDTFRIMNSSTKSVDVFINTEHESTSPFITIPAGQSWNYTDQYSHGERPYFHTFFGLVDSAVIRFSDGKKIKFYSADKFDESGNWISLPGRRICGLNGEEFYPIAGINDFISTDGWFFSCDSKERCEFDFVITDKYYQYSK